jgi:hypothetical protein
VSDEKRRHRRKGTTVRREDTVNDWTSWADFSRAARDLAAFGRARLLSSEVAYLATVRDGLLPRVHPVEPIVSDHRLMLFMFPTSPKAHDLRRDGRYALHSAVADAEGSTGEFLLRGHARLVEDPAIRDEAATAGYPPRPEYILFELGVSYALTNEYINGNPNYRRWPPAGAGRHEERR